MVRNSLHFEGLASLGRGVFRRDSDGDIFPDHDSPVARLFDGRPIRTLHSTLSRHW